MQFSIDFDPTPEIKDLQNKLQEQFRFRIKQEIANFFAERKVHTGGGKLETINGPGMLLINDWLEKKFDDPATTAKMEAYFEANFERIMGESLQKALEHKAKKFAFNQPDPVKAE